ncbi:MAG: GAF domain-containing sensor histidine kinase, partial [Dehalococcoidia bacterium]|nr:GAF domain-containing sensor histidine kinase [Dehalococcoidia bacterium]
ILVDDISLDPRLTRPVVSEEGLRAFLSVPIRSRDKTIAVLNITSREPRHFSSQDIRLLSAIGSQVGVAIERARLYDEVKQKEQMRGNLLRQIISAQEDERKRIARDLHDETSQALTALTMHLESVVRKPPEAEEMKASLKKIQGMATRTLEDVHRIIFDLRPSLLDDLGLIAALRWYAQYRLEPHGVTVNIETRGPERRLPGEIEAALYRIAQEAISNIAQHAQAKRADLCLEFKANSLVLTVEDDGAGFDAGKVVRSDDKKRGLGLMGMKERAELLGGVLDIRSRNGHGTRVTLAVPVTWSD